MPSKIIISTLLKTSAVAIIAALTLSATSCKKEEQTTTERQVDLAPLDIELPEPQFVGTPQDIRSDNLGEITGESRGDFLAPKGARNVALGKKATSSDTEPIIGELKYATDGDKEAITGSYVELGPGVQWLQIDLGSEYRIYAIVVWHYHAQARVYHDVIVQVSSDPDFSRNVRTVFNNDHDASAGMGVGRDKEWVETNDGKLINTNPDVGESKNPKGVIARYVRLYSNGSTADDMNHYTEVEVYGEAAE